MAAPAELEDLRVISPATTADLYGVHVRTLQRMVKTGDVPAPVKVSKGRIGFRLLEVRAALADLPPHAGGLIHMQPQNGDGSRASRPGTRLDAHDDYYRRLAGIERHDTSNRAPQAQPRKTSPHTRRRLNDQVAHSAYQEAKSCALKALTAKAEWEREELRERSRAAWALFKQASVEAAQ